MVVDGYPASRSSISLKTESAMANSVTLASSRSWARPQRTSSPTAGIQASTRSAGVMLW